MIESKAKILSNTPLTQDVFKMELETEIATLAKPGQFVQITVPNFYLRRPISVSWVEGNVLTIVYKVLGKGTDKLSSMRPGHSLSVLGPLGTGYPIEAKEEVLIVGGGVGTPPMLLTAKAYQDLGAKVHVVLGFNTKDEVFYQKEFEELGITPVICTMDGSMGVQGTVLDGIKANHITCPFVCSCGPLPMLRAIQNTYQDGYISLESRMGCGFGVCLGCVMKTVEGDAVRVCEDGPVFAMGKVVL